MSDDTLGRCCGCQCEDGVNNVLLLNYRTPEPGTGWGCVVCKLPPAGAVAVMCDKCMKRNVKPAWFCLGYPGQNRRAPWSELGPPFDHDMSVDHNE